MTLRTRAANAIGEAIACCYIAVLEATHPARWARVTHQPTPEEDQ